MTKVLSVNSCAHQGLHVVSGGTSATIAARVLNKHIKASLIYEDPDIPPTAEIDGLDLVTEGVLTLNRAVSMMHEYNEGRQDQSFFKRLDEKNGGSQLAKLIIERCTHLHLFVGEAMNRLIRQLVFHLILVSACVWWTRSLRKAGRWEKQSVLNIIEDDMYEDNIYY